MTPQSRSSEGGGGNVDHGVGIRRRRPSSRAEQERRKAWGAEWGKVGAAWKRDNATKGH